MQKDCNWISNFSGSAGRAIIEQAQEHIFLLMGSYTNQAISQNWILNSFKIKHLNKTIGLHLKKYNQMQNISNFFGFFSCTQ